MTDRHPPNIRSKNMSAIKSADTKPEKIVKNFLCNFGLRYRKSSNEYKFKPDFIFPGIKHVIFVHGCFWHRHDCKFSTSPNSNKQFWKKKFIDNKQRDQNHYHILKYKQWSYDIVWECELNLKNKTDKILSQVCNNIKTKYDQNSLYIK